MENNCYDLSVILRYLLSGIRILFLFNLTFFVFFLYLLAVCPLKIVTIALSTGDYRNSYPILQPCYVDHNLLIKSAISNILSIFLSIGRQI